MKNVILNMYSKFSPLSRFKSDLNLKETLKSDSHVGEEFNRIKPFFGLVKKIPSFVWLLFEYENFIDVITYMLTQKYYSC